MYAEVIEKKQLESAKNVMPPVAERPTVIPVDVAVATEEAF